MSELTSRFCSRNIARILFASLLCGYCWLLVRSSHGPSERGAVLILEYLPVVLLAIQTAFPLHSLWWAFVVFSGVYGLTLMTALSSFESDDVVKAAIWLWVVLVLFVTQPSRE